MGGIPLLGITEAALLIALGFGFVIIFLGRKEEQNIKSLAHGIGMTIIALSLFFVIASILMIGVAGPSMKGGFMPCPMMRSR
jgi:high-affinity Fe2+/Pb2+ permease